ncbi:biotin transporter BioY [Cellulomonas soli]|uniref:biotin transporter BioY n=1 Tax=Cellulomonas soli TaxID=931535 RepID=UPI003F84605B
MSGAPEKPAPAATPAVTTGVTTGALPAPASRSAVTTDVALIATFAAFIAVCAILPGIPTPSGVPITLQTFAVILAGIVLGARRGTLAVLLYLAIGLAGLPVFAGGTGGTAVLAGPSVGYLLAFPLGAALAGFLAGRVLRARLTRRASLRVVGLFAAGLLASLLTIHPLGIAGLMWRLDLGLTEAILIDARYLPGDVLKNVCAAIVATAVFRAFPELARTRR